MVQLEMFRKMARQQAGQWGCDQISPTWPLEQTQPRTECLMLRHDGARRLPASWLLTFLARSVPHAYLASVGDGRGLWSRTAQRHRSQRFDPPLRRISGDDGV